MEMLAVRCKLQVDMLLIVDGTFRSGVLRMEVLCVVTQCLKMRYVFIQTLSCGEKHKKKDSRLSLSSPTFKCGFFVLGQERKSAEIIN